MDALCFEDLDLFGTELDDPLLELEQDLFHRLIEAPGSNLDDLDRGLGLEEKLQGVIDPALSSQIENELRKDDRVSDARATITDEGSNTYRISIEVAVNGKALGFSLDYDPALGLRRAVS